MKIPQCCHDMTCSEYSEYSCMIIPIHNCLFIGGSGYERNQLLSFWTPANEGVTVLIYKGVPAKAGIQDPLAVKEVKETSN